MKISKNIELSIGIIGVIIALSPFVDFFKSIEIAHIPGTIVTVYTIYLAYVLVFVFYIFFHLYYDAFYSNLNKRDNFLKWLNFSYLVVLTFIPVLISAILTIRFYLWISPGQESNVLRTNGFLILVAIYLFVSYYNRYTWDFRQFSLREGERRGLNIDIKLMDYLIDNKEYKELALLQYELAKKILLFNTRTSFDELPSFSITDCITLAYKQHRISIKQKESYQAIAASSEIAYNDLEELSTEFTKRLTLNNWFLKEELSSIISV